MYKIISFSLAIFLISGFQTSAFSEEASSTQNDVLVYTDMIGGPYSDDWYISGDLKKLNDIKVYRNGKSGELEATIQVDCELQSIAMKGKGLLYTSITLTKEETQEYFSKEITKAIIDKICPQ